MTNPLLEHPAPDFAELQRVLRGEHKPRRVHIVELGVDPEVRQSIIERYLGESYIPRTEETTERHFVQLITLYWRLGYDYVPIPQWSTMWINHPPPPTRLTKDTADLSRGEREWVDESRGLISTWEEFEQFPWDRIQPDLSFFELAARNLPEGMKIAVETEFFEHVLEVLLGYEGLFYLLYDDRRLVEAVFARWGQKIHDFYQSVIDMEGVGVLFHGDDLGYKTSTLLSPDDLRHLVFPWFRKYVALAHEHDKMFWLHSCGNLYAQGVIEDLIEHVQIDALHSFQDTILPVGDFKARYGSRVAALGGVDMDKLARLDRATLREHVRDILGQCLPDGRFALGSGNTVANYIPLSNYLVMLEEGRRWQV